MASSLSNLIDNLDEGIHKNKRKYAHGNKNYKTYEINTRIVSVVLKYTNTKNDLVHYNCLCCNKKSPKNV